jgi:hypothetical protein
MFQEGPVNLLLLIIVAALVTIIFQLEAIKRLLKQGREP